MSQQVITFHYELKDEKGALIESSREGGQPLAFLEGSGQIIPGLEQALTELNVGQSKEVFVPCSEGYGVYDQSLIQQVPRQQMPIDEIKQGDMFQIEKEGHARVAVVIDVNDKVVTLDSNHPMAGRDLTFVVEIMNKREATPEEIDHGHIHGEGGHHHH